MKKNLKKVLSIFLLFALLLTMFPAAVYAEEGELPDEPNEEEIPELEELSDSSEILELDAKVPENLATAPSAYNEGLENPFLLLEKNELYLYGSYKDGDMTANPMYLIDTLDTRNFTEEDGYATIPGFTKSSVKSYKQYGGFYMELNFAQGVAFDPTGSGKNDHVAYVGYLKSEDGDSGIYVYVKDLTNASAWNLGESICLGPATWMEDQKLFYMDNFFSITAGDYDKDGKDSLVVYYAGDQHEIDQYHYTSQCYLYEVELEEDGLTKTEILNLDDYISFWGWDWTWAVKNEFYNMPIVSLGTGDFNGDGRDQLAFSVGFGNPADDEDGNKEDGYQEFRPGELNPSLDYFATQLYICDYDETSGIQVSDAPGALMQLWDLGERDEVTSEYRKFKTNILHNGAITVGDMDGDGLDEILAVGYTDHDKARAYYDRNEDKLLYVDDICNWNDSNLVYSVAQFDGTGYTRGEVTRLEMNEFTKKGTYTEDDRVHSRIGLGCAKTNGASAPVDVFVAGDIYSFESGDANPVYQPEWFNNSHSHDLTGDDGDDASNQWFRNVTAGNFDKNDAGREQFVFTVFLKHSGKDQYSANLGYMGGIEYADNYENGELTGLSETPGVYATNLKYKDVMDHNYGLFSDKPTASQLCVDKSWSLDLPLYFVPLAVCINDDSILGRERGYYYLYTDPRVEAVLEAAPYFGELNELGGHDAGETTYTVETSFARSSGHSHTTTLSVGVAAESVFKVVKVGLDIGYTHTWNHEWEKTTTVTHTTSFTGMEEDVVVISRVPILINSYDIWQPPIYDADGNIDEAGCWVEYGYNVNAPQAPVYFLLSVDDYNAFVDEYNTRMTTDVYKDGELIYDAEAENPILLKKIKTSGSDADLPENHIGNPENYWSEWRFVPNSVNLSANTYSCTASVNGAITSEWSKEAEQSETKSHENGLYVDVSVQGGGSDWFFGFEAWIGIHVNVTSTWGRSSTITKTKANGTSGTVNNINKSALLAQGIPESTINAYQFNWTFGQWTRPLSTDEKASPVPFFGYQVYNVMSPLPPPQDLTVEEIGSNLVLTWKAPEIYNPSRIKGYNVYRVSDDNVFTLIGSTEATINEFSFAPDGSQIYRFAVRAKDANNIESVNSNIARYVMAPGAGIASIELTGSEGNVDTYTITLTNGDTYTFTVTNGIGIASVELTISGELTDTYTVTFTDGSFTTFTVHHGKDGLSAYELAVQNGFEGTLDEWIASLAGNGVGIDRIEKTGTSEDGLVDTYTIYLTDGNVYSFTVTNGKDGADGHDGVDGRGIVSVEKTESSGNVDTYTITYSDGSTSTFMVANGKDGVGIDRIEKTATSDDGLTDTYTIYLTNGTTYTFTVTNGHNGQDGHDGQDGQNGVGIERIEKTGTTEDDLYDIYTIYLTDGSTYSFYVIRAATHCVGRFTDVIYGQYFAEPVAWAVEQGITEGTSKTTFSPHANCTRAQTITFLWRAVGSPKPKTTHSPFTDVRDSRAYYYQAVLWAVENKITSGTTGRTFGPNELVSRAQAVTFLWRMEGSPMPVSSHSEFIDVTSDAYYYNAVYWAMEQNITNGATRTMFGPNRSCTRAHIVTFLYRDMALFEP